METRVAGMRRSTIKKKIPKPQKNDPKETPDPKDVEQKQKDFEEIHKEIVEQSKTDFYVPSWKLLLRIFTVIRLISALTAPIQDCDEVYNYLEPFHFLLFGYGKQTWEYAPQFALRSWLPLSLFGYAIKSFHFLYGFTSKVQLYYAIRVLVSLLTAACEATFIRAVNNHMGGRVAIYTMFSLFFGAGMFHASPSFLPSTLSMQLVMIAYSYGVIPSPTLDFLRGLVRATLCLLPFAISSVWGWPYSGILAFPWIVEHLFVRGTETFAANVTNEKIIELYKNWRIQRIVSFSAAAVISVLLSVGPSVLVDSYFYNRLVFPSLNQVVYNVFPKSFLTDPNAVVGPNLYGTEPWYYYIVNGFINWNFIFIFATGTIPLLGARRLLELIQKSMYNNEDSTKTKKELKVELEKKQLEDKDASLPVSKKPTSTPVLLFYRTFPPILMLIILSLQPHKEERFMYPLYPLLCLNAAVSFETMRIMTNHVFYIVGANEIVKRSIQGAHYFTIFILAISSSLSVLRMIAISNNYSSATKIYQSIPRPITYGRNSANESSGPLNIGPSLRSYVLQMIKWNKDGDDLGTESPTGKSNGNLLKTVCVGKDWYRFPSHFMLPNDYKLVFLLSKFDGLLPGDFKPMVNSSLVSSTSATVENANCINQFEPRNILSTKEPELYCDYLIDIDFSEKKDLERAHYELDNNGKGATDIEDREPNYRLDVEKWRTVKCLPFLNSAKAPIYVRTFYLHGKAAWVLNKIFGREKEYWGEVCLLKSEKKN
ncbi:hypothetical protein BB559_003793 [Furculomyces boomerangus]|uniref:Mannosyltransferase n=1 Tax=Furculomyces boomerangus TaxID=61424 RepID=A0A2T9YIN2_9FUNG|nr:hypothetical protein BB559_003793 [Furculomyces boomerangus]